MAARLVRDPDSGLKGTRCPASMFRLADQHPGVAQLVGDPHVGRLPLKMPVPPRIWVFWSPVTSQLMPTRGDHSIFVSGIWPVLDLTGCPFSSRNVSASAAGLANDVFLNLRDVEADARRSPSGCGAAATRPARSRRVPDVEQLRRLVDAGNVAAAHLELRRGSPATRCGSDWPGSRSHRRRSPPASCRQ